MAIMWIRLEIENLSSPLNGITGKSFQALELSREWLIVPHVVLKEDIVVIINFPTTRVITTNPQCVIINSVTTINTFMINNIHQPN